MLKETLWWVGAHCGPVEIQMEASPQSLVIFNAFPLHPGKRKTEVEDRVPFLGLIIYPFILHNDNNNKSYIPCFRYSTHPELS